LSPFHAVRVLAASEVAGEETRLVPADCPRGDAEAGGDDFAVRVEGEKLPQAAVTEALLGGD